MVHGIGGRAAEQKGYSHTHSYTLTRQGLHSPILDLFQLRTQCPNPGTTGDGYGGGLAGWIERKGWVCWVRRANEARVVEQAARMIRPRWESGLWGGVLWC